MEANEAKKPKRPRIQSMPGLSDAQSAENHYEKNSYAAGQHSEGNDAAGGYGQGGYQPRQSGYNNNRGPVRQGKTFTPRPKRIEYEMPLPDPNEQIRLNKFMANAGLCRARLLPGR